MVSEPVLFLNGHTEEEHLQVRRMGQVLLTNLSLMVGPTWRDFAVCFFLGDPYSSIIEMPCA